MDVTHLENHSKLHLFQYSRVPLRSSDVESQKLDLRLTKICNLLYPSKKVYTIKKMPLLAQRSLMSSASRFIRVLDTVQEGGGVSTFKKNLF